MAILLLRLTGPMQSWGTTSRFDQRDTGKEPSKSGVIGLLAAALGIDRHDWEALKPLSVLSMAVRHDRAGVLRNDYHTAGCSKSDVIIKANGKKEKKDGIVSNRFYLADAAFLVGLEGERPLLQSIQDAIQNPKWVLSLGRKSYVPSEAIWFNEGVQEGTLLEIISIWPWISNLRNGESYPEKLLLSKESSDVIGVLKMDQPISNFAERRFGARFVESIWISFPHGGTDVSI